MVNGPKHHCSSCWQRGWNMAAASIEMSEDRILRAIIQLSTSASANVWVQVACSNSCYCCTPTHDHSSAAPRYQHRVSETIRGGVISVLKKGHRVNVEEKKEFQQRQRIPDPRSVISHDTVNRNHTIITIITIIIIIIIIIIITFSWCFQAQAPHYHFVLIPHNAHPRRSHDRRRWNHPAIASSDLWSCCF